MSAPPAVWAKTILDVIDVRLDREATARALEERDRILADRAAALRGQGRRAVFYEPMPDLNVFAYEWTCDEPPPLSMSAEDAHRLASRIIADHRELARRRDAMNRLAAAAGDDWDLFDLE